MNQNVRQIDEIILSPRDIPGGLFDKNRSIEEHAVTELKRWLQVRGLKRTGSKQDLVQRCIDCISAKRDNIVDISIDAGKWYEKAVEDREKQLGSSSASSSNQRAPIIPITNWGNFPSVNIPKYFNDGYVHNYMYEQCPKIAGMSRDDNTTVKPLKRGVLYCDSGFISEVKDKSDATYYYLKCKVRASFENHHYNCTATLSQNSSAIIDCTCDCKQSSLGRCSHVAALLQFLLDHTNNYGYDAKTCTGKPCYWGQGSKHRNPQKVHEATYQRRNSSTRIKRAKKIEFDPRPTDMKKKEMDIKSLCNIMHHEALLANRGGSPHMWEMFLPFEIYENFILGPDDIEILQICNDNFYENLFEVVLSYKHHPLCKSLVVPHTENQSEDVVWHNFRRQILSASTAKSVSRFTTVEAKKNFLASKLWGIGKVQTQAMKYGLEFEDDARQQYQKSNPTYEISTVGLLLDPDCPQLGCSPDALVKKESGEVTLLEIKCFPTLKEGHPKDFDKLLNKKQLGNFPLSKTKSGLILKKNHSIYYQIQMQLGITKLNLCTLLFWSSFGILTLDIEYDDDFYMSFKHKLLAFHSEYLVPEWFLMRTPRDLNPVQITHFQGRSG